MMELWPHELWFWTDFFPSPSLQGKRIHPVWGLSPFFWVVIFHVCGFTNYTFAHTVTQTINCFFLLLLPPFPVFPAGETHTPSFLFLSVLTDQILTRVSARPETTTGTRETQRLLLTAAPSPCPTAAPITRQEAKAECRKCVACILCKRSSAWQTDAIRVVIYGNNLCRCIKNKNKNWSEDFCFIFYWGEV